MNHHYPHEQQPRNNDDDSETAVVEMEQCPACGHLVPVANMTVHEARGCLARKRAPGNHAATTTAAATRSNLFPMDVETVPAAASLDDMEPSTPERPVARRPPAASTSAISIHSDDSDRKPAARRNRQHHGRRRSSSGGILQTGDYVDLAADEDDGDYVDLAADDDDDDSGENHRIVDRAAPDKEENKDYWECPRCTLHNQKTQQRCEACGASCPEQDRPADPTRRERLIPDGGFGVNEGWAAAENSQHSPAMFMSGGALLGGIMGAAGAYLSGQPLSSGLLEGAVSGAVGGAVLQEVAQLASPPRHAAAARATNPGSVRTVRRRVGPNGATVSVTTFSSPSSTQHPDDSFLNAAMQQYAQQMIMMQAMMPHHQGRLITAGYPGNIDTMSYEQLLQAFGDGSEMRGADDGDIGALPTCIVSDKHSLPEDARQCMVCLEEFENGDCRKTLPCLHGFHEACIDKWLRSNASCPVCKHRIRGD